MSKGVKIEREFSAEEVEFLEKIEEERKRREKVEVDKEFARYRKFMARVKEVGRERKGK